MPRNSGGSGLTVQPSLVVAAWAGAATASGNAAAATAVRARVANRRVFVVLFMSCSIR